MFTIKSQQAETVFLNFQGAQEQSASLCSLAGWYDIPIPTRFLYPIDWYKIPPLFWASILGQVMGGNIDLELSGVGHVP